MKFRKLTLLRYSNIETIMLVYSTSPLPYILNEESWETLSLKALCVRTDILIGLIKRVFYFHETQSYVALYTLEFKHTEIPYIDYQFFPAFQEVGYFFV